MLKQASNHIDRFVDKVKSIARDSRVSLSMPDRIFGIIIADKVYHCILFNSLRVRLRKVFKHPAELDAKLARLMINLSGVKEGEILLDPCCGTGTILLYASYHGINAIGCDLSIKMCKASKLNLEANNLDALVINADSRRIPINRADAIVSNMPYGRASSTYGANSRDLVNDIINECKKISNNMVLMCKKGDEPDDMLYYDFYVHRNLIRRLAICR